MPIRKQIKTGDRIEATAKDGSKIIGVAMNDVQLGGLSHLMIAMNHETVAISINTNFWEVVSETPKEES